ncbi:LuxR family transcriptional regulator [Nocardia panacis]|uniref:LuxR family transcriptional regulator n=2 Tax=Nocardia panacis TaxID=2340916 RepID=A0A3A4KNQ2_9NOCA|nr:LuxR family transcriptional regulator [Nocardia panacis]
MRLAEPMLARRDVPTPDLAAAVRICAAVLTRRGLVDRAAQLYTWLGPNRVGADWAVGATVLSLAGDRTGAQTLSTYAGHWPPTAATAQAGLIATALARTIGETTDASGTLGVPESGGRNGLPPRANGRDRVPTPAVGGNGTPRPTVRDGAAGRSGGEPTGFTTANPRSLGGTNTAATRSTTEPTGFTTAMPAINPHPIGDTTRAGNEPTGFTTAMPAISRDPSRRFDGTNASGGATSFATAGQSINHFPARPLGETNTTAAISALIQATHADASVGLFLPVTAVATATLLCLSVGAPHRAEDALRRATANGARSPGVQVLIAWTAMLGGDEQSAAAALAALDPNALDIRDQLLAHAVAVGLARRGGDHAALVRAWQAACPLFDDVNADLLALLPIGELWLAGIRLRDERRIAPLVDAALALLRRLGDPPAWANAFHWYGVQAAIAHESPQELLPHAHALRAAAEAGDRHATLLAAAGRTWVLVLRGQVDAAAVRAAVAQLSEIGLTWDAARLASESALAAADSATATVLLKLARTVRAEARPMQRPVPAATAPEPAPQDGSVLSEREREVAELVLLGLTYREIGARLYISAKTVEHHVARIRRRIGARSRSELLSMLRAMGHGSLLV